MTDRFNAFTVILEKDIRDDDAESLMNAISHIRGVLKVEPHVSNFSDAIAYARARSELIQKIWDALTDKKGE